MTQMRRSRTFAARSLRHEESQRWSPLLASSVAAVVPPGVLPRRAWRHALLLITGDGDAVHRQARRRRRAPDRPHLTPAWSLLLLFPLFETVEWEAALFFWVRNRQQFPSYFVLAGSFFGAVGSSSSCQRAFSFTGRLVSDERSSLSVECVEMRSLVAANTEMVPKQSSAEPTMTKAQAKAFRDRMNSFKAEKEGGCADLDELSSGESSLPSDAV